MKIKNIKQALFLFGLLISLPLSSQNLRWSFEVIAVSGTQSYVNVYLQNISSTPENINTFSTIFYYSNPMSNATSFDVSPATLNLWPNNGIASSNLANTGSNGNVSIPHNAFAAINLTDTRVGTPGILIPGNSAPIHVLTINFTNQSPASLGWLTETDEFSGLAYTNSDFDEFPVIVTGLQFAPLPIKMKSFSAIKDGERASRLDWVTSSEVNSDYFGVERSADGNTWEQIGQVAAAGNSNTDIAYQFLDRKLPSFRAGENIFYYRLRLTDLDGQYKYSDVRGVNFGKLSNSIISIYPNPTTEIINVDISGMSLDAGDVTLSVFDMNGRNMISKNIIGNGIELIDVDQYPSGTYNVVVQQGETIQQKKIIKID